MKSITVKDLMIPLSEYATVGEDASLHEAVMALEEAQREFDSTRYRHRAVLVLDMSGNVVGKLTQLDALRALEPKYLEIQGQERVRRSGFSKTFMKSLLESYQLWDLPLSDICENACNEKIAKYMQRLTEGEFVDEKSTLDEVIHQLVLGHHQSLLVNHENKIVGIIRLTDVFATVFHVMKKCTCEQ